MVEILVLYYDAIFKSFGFGFVLIRFLTNDPHFVTDCCEMPSSGSSSKKQQFQVHNLTNAQLSLSVYNS